MLKSLTQQWQERQKEVAALERRYADDVLAHAQGNGPHPTSKQRLHLAAMRRDAATLLAEALAAIDARGVVSRERVKGLR